jgi:cell division protein FtsA
MEGVVELAEEIFHMPVRIGVPQDARGLTDIIRNPIYATGVGLLHYGIKHQAEQGGRGRGRIRSGGFLANLKQWIQNNF